MARNSLAVSAPGKVLFTGGFLVLDRKHTGLVLGLNARIHVHIEAWQPEETIAVERKDVLTLVQSPQFHNARWLYKINESAVDTASFIRQVVEYVFNTSSPSKMSN